MTEKKITTKGGQKGKAASATVNHETVARTLAAVLTAEPEGKTARAVVRAADKLGGAIGQPEIYDLRPILMLRRLLDAHTSCAYDLDGQDKRKGQRAYDELVARAHKARDDGRDVPARR